MSDAMPRRDFLKALAYGAAALSLPGCLSSRGSFLGPAGRDKPNIIFIMTDDQGPWAFKAAPNSNAHTPNIDRLCREGVRLTNHFVTTPVCSPSRAGYLTSRYSSEVDIPDYLSDRDPNLGLDVKLSTWPRILNKSGYATALIGKWHLGKQDQYYPTHYGYDEFAGFRIGGRISKDPMVEIKGKICKVPGYTPDILTDLGINFIRRNRENPFLLSLHFWAPHANTSNRTPDGDRTWLPLSDADWEQFKNADPSLPEPDYRKLDVPRAKRMMREYLASVASVDRNVGRLLDVLDALGLADNTVVIFTSDNGYNMAHHGIWHKGNGRWLLTDNVGPRPNMYDNSIKVPAVVRWPVELPAGTTVDRTITNLDWFPTILAMAGVPLPAGCAIRGRNFLRLLMGKALSWDNDLFAQYSMWPWHQTGAILRCFRTPRWKLVRDFEHKDKDELYDLVNDPAERRSLIDSPDQNIQKVRERLDAKLLKKMRGIGDPVLDIIASRDGEK